MKALMQINGAPDAQVSSPAPMVRLSGVRKFFLRRDGIRVPAIDGISLDVAPGEFVVLLGPSGCGKTTLLRCIAGLECPDEGSIRIRDVEHFSSGKELNSGPEARDLGMVFQSYALWPHMKVFDNIAFPPRTRKMNSRDVREQVNRVLEAVGITELAQQYPGQLSGGQQQRVALARALISNHELILFDEPLSNVDAKVREQLRFEIVRMQKEFGFAAVYVTHDQQEAMELADRIAILKLGKIAQLGSPREIYQTPANRYVANFIGQVNEIEGVIESLTSSDSESMEAVVKTSAGPIVAIVGQDGLVLGEKVVVVIRPERCVLQSPDMSARVNTWPVRVLSSMFMGSQIEHVVTGTGLHEIRAYTDAHRELPQGQIVLHFPKHLTRILRIG